MRIDDASKSSAAVNANVGDLISRLDTGDVIRAKVIEITSDEAVLRLFDGSSLKAKLAEKLDAEAGQTITLNVVSKNEGTLILETVKNLDGKQKIDPGILKNILESLKLKPDNNKLEIAAELIKNGSQVTKESIGKALQLMESIKDLPAGKAALLSSKGIENIRPGAGLAVKLLNGELKLGKLLDDLLNAFEKTPVNNESGTGVEKNNGVPLSVLKSTEDIAGLPSDKTVSAGNTAVVVQGRQTGAATGGRAASNPIDPGTDSAAQQTAADGNEADNASKTTPVKYKVPDNTSTDKVILKYGAARPDQGGMPEELPDDIKTPQNSLAGTSSASGRHSAPDLFSIRTDSAYGDVPSSPSAGNASEKSLESGSVVKAGNRNVRMGISDNTAEDSLKVTDPDRTASDPVSKLRDGLKDIFVSTDSENLSSELNVGNIYKELDSRLDAVKTAMQSADMQGTKADLISNTASMLGDAVKLIDQLNSGGMMYYQIPVKISDNNTTAELYIMKKQKSKKKIDPDNTVMFIALDTANLGRVETLIDVKGKNINIQIRTEKQEIGDYIRGYTKDLYNGLSELGFKLNGIRFKIIDEPATPVKQEKLLKEMEQGYMGRVDFRV